MITGFSLVSGRTKLKPEKPPSLVDLCVQTTIDNIRYLGNVGDLDMHLLERILPHCTIEQLMHVENETEGRDLSHVTDKLWKKFYEAVFGTVHTHDVVEKMKMCKRKFLWRQLYQAKLMVQGNSEKQYLDRLTQQHKKEEERRRCGKVKLCPNAPTSGTKRCFNGGNGIGSKEVDNHMPIKRKVIPKSDHM